MSTNDDSEFEKRTRALLEESLTRIDGRVRSRLNQARHAALEAVPGERALFVRRTAWIPATGAVAAAVLIGVMLWTQRTMPLPAIDVAQSPAEDLELLADSDALEMVEDWDGAFYEWAAAQAESGEGASG